MPLSNAARKVLTELRATPQGKEHARLLKLVPKRPEDYEPWGENERWKDPSRAYPDCSGGCKFARWLEDRPGISLGTDWCVCTNPKSHRCGLLTFEHQGCQAFKQEKDEERFGT